MAVAQSQVSGTILADDGEPAIGATVKDASGKTVAVTDADGHFTANVPAGSQLTINYMGMKPKTFRAGQNSRISLEADTRALDETIVVAYGTQKKSAFTGSAVVLKSEDIAKVQVQNPVNALVGKAAGVQINTASGQPGSNPSIRIRGISSINAGNSPLIVMDGVPFDGDLNDVNPQDIASLTVLKDAASSALYGARGANGVILITTKQGNRSHSSITFDAKWGSNQRAIPDYEYVTSPAKHYELWYQSLKNYAMNDRGYNLNEAHRYANEHLAVADPNDAMSLQYNVYDLSNLAEGEYMIGMNGKLNPNARLGNVVSGYMLLPDDWVDAAYQNGLRQEYSLTASAGNEKSNFYASANYLNNEGITYNSDYERFTGRLKADYQMRPWLKLSGNFSYAHFNANSLSEDGVSSSSANIFALTKMAPIYPLYLRDADGNILYNERAGISEYDYGDGSNAGITRPFLADGNPLASNQLDVNNNEGNTFNAVGVAEVRFLKDFKFTTTNSAYLNEARSTGTTNPYYGQYAVSNGIVSKEHTRTWAFNYQQLLNWTHSFDLHNVEVMAGHEYYRTRYYYLYASRKGMFNQTNLELNGAVNDNGTSSYTTDYNTEGWFGRALYNYDEKYFGSVSYRRDASSRFAKDHRWGNFWSFGGAWIISKEKWFDADWVNELKLKASYGEQGNDQIGNYRYTNLYSLENVDGMPGLRPDSKGNSNISWEKNGNFNVGAEFSLFNGKLNGEAEFFIRSTRDMLARFPLAPTGGFTSKYMNVGNMRNTGVELTLSGDIIRTRDFNWEAHANITYYKNKITKLADESKTYSVDGVDGYSSGNYYYGEGESLYTFYMKKYAGVDEETGVSMWWKDVTDEEGNVTGQERTTSYSDATNHLCGTALPDAYGGFGTSVEWKGFDFSIDFSYQLGGKILDSDYMSAMDGSSPGNIFHVDMLNAWTPEHHTNIPRIQYGDSYVASTSDRFLISASYLSLNNVQLGYTLPKSLTRRIEIDKVRVYVTADNVWVWSKRQGLDPRQSITGSVTSTYYAPMRTISGGITVTF